MTSAAGETHEVVGARRSYKVEALAKGLSILSLFSSERPALRVKEIVQLSGIPMPTTFRLVATLEGEGYLERTVDGMVRPGTGVLALGFAALQGLDLVQTSSATVRELARTTAETVSLGVLFGDQVLFVARIQRQNSLIAASIRVGSTVPAVFSSIGKVLLAYATAEDFDQRITEQSFAGRWGPHAVTSIAQLKKQLNTARSFGWVVQHEEAVPGLSSIAAPIRQTGGEVIAALNVSVPSSEYDSQRLVSDFKGPLIDACDEISKRLGGTPA